MRVVILGAGGVGGYLGARLIAGGADVAFLVREKRAEDLRAQGLAVKSPLGDFHSRVRVLTSAAEATSPADVVVLACKAHGIDAALEAVAPLLADATRLLPVLNGVRHIETLRGRFPGKRILGGIAHGAIDLREDGTIVHLTPFITLTVGAPGGGFDAVADAFVRTLAAAGEDALLSTEIEQELWNKFVFLTTLAGSTCLMRASIGTILDTDAGRDLILQLLEECRAVGGAEGHAPRAEVMAGYRSLLTQPGSTLTSSMLRDIQGRRRTEGDHILGDMLRRGQAHNLPTPLLRTAATHLQAYERALAQRDGSL